MHLLSRRLSWLAAPRRHEVSPVASRLTARQHLRQGCGARGVRRVQAPCRALSRDEESRRDVPGPSSGDDPSSSTSSSSSSSSSGSSSGSSSSGVEAGSYTYASMAARLDSMDANQLQTALATAIAAEDYDLAARVRDALVVKVRGEGGSGAAVDWRSLGVPAWLTDRLERLQLPFPTEVQRRALPVLQSGADAVITSQTGSGKTLAVLVPALATALDYPPALFPEDLDGPQLILLVPTFELGVQACLLVYKLLGGNISPRHPGDTANMFTFNGPRGIKVRGLLNEEEVMMAKQGQYLQGVHVVVATPDAALSAVTGTGALHLFTDLKMLVCDEADALLRDFPAAAQQLLDMAIARAEPPAADAGGGSASDGSGSGSGGDASNGASSDVSEAGVSGRVEGSGAGQAGGDVAGTAGAAGAADAAAGGTSIEWDVNDRMKRLQEALKRRESSGAGSNIRLGSTSGSGSSDGMASSVASGSGRDSSSASSSSSDLEAELAAVDVEPIGKPQLVLLGATVGDREVGLAVERGWLVDHVEVAVGQADTVPVGLKHRVVVAEGARKLAVLTRMLRLDLEAGSADAAPARAIVFAESEEQARFAADPLRSALWSQHALSVLLPGGAEPVKALTAFRDRAASLLLATPAAARGLDLPAVSHVYNLGPPPDAAEYLHRAGRSGRVGSTTGGIVTSIVTPEELPQVLALCEQLGLEAQVDDDVAAELAAAAAAAAGTAEAEAEPALGKVELGDEQLGKMRRGLEDLFNLM